VGHTPIAVCAGWCVPLLLLLLCRGSFHLTPPPPPPTALIKPLVDALTQKVPPSPPPWMHLEKAMRLGPGVVTLAKGASRTSLALALAAGPSPPRISSDSLSSSRASPRGSISLRSQAFFGTSPRLSSSGSVTMASTATGDAVVEGPGAPGRSSWIGSAGAAGRDLRSQSVPSQLFPLCPPSCPSCQPCQPCQPCTHVTDSRQATP